MAKLDPKKLRSHRISHRRNELVRNLFESKWFVKLKNWKIVKCKDYLFNLCNKRTAVFFIPLYCACKNESSLAAFKTCPWKLQQNHRWISTSVSWFASFFYQNLILSSWSIFHVQERGKIAPHYEMQMPTKIGEQRPLFKAFSSAQISLKCDRSRHYNSCSKFPKISTAWQY